MTYELKEQMFQTNIQKMRKGLVAVSDLFMRIDVMDKLNSIYTADKNRGTRKVIRAIAVESLGISQEGFIATAIEKIRKAIRYIVDKIVAAAKWIAEKISKAINWVKSKFIKKKVEEAKKKEASSKEAIEYAAETISIVPVDTVAPHVEKILTTVFSYSEYDPDQMSEEEAMEKLADKEEEIKRWLTTKVDVTLNIDRVAKCLYAAQNVIANASRNAPRLTKRADDYADRAADYAKKGDDGMSKMCVSVMKVIKEAATIIAWTVPKVNTIVGELVGVLADLSENKRQFSM